MTYILEDKSAKGQPSIITRSNVRPIPKMDDSTCNDLSDSPSGETDDNAHPENDDNIIEDEVKSTNDGMDIDPSLNLTVLKRRWKMISAKTM